MCVQVGLPPRHLRQLLDGERSEGAFLGWGMHHVVTMPAFTPTLLMAPALDLLPMAGLLWERHQNLHNTIMPRFRTSFQTLPCWQSLHDRDHRNLP